MPDTDSEIRNNSLELVIFKNDELYQDTSLTANGFYNTVYKSSYPVSYFLNDAREIYPKLDKIRDHINSELYYLLIKDDENLKNDINRKLFDELIYKHFEEKYDSLQAEGISENYFTFLYTVLSINNFKNQLIHTGFLKIKYGVYYVSRNLLKYILEKFSSSPGEQSILYPEKYLKFVNRDKDRFEKYWMWEVDMR